MKLRCGYVVFLWIASLFSSHSFRLKVPSKIILSRLFCYVDESRGVTRIDFAKVHRALQIYAHHFGECRIHTHFTVPSGAPWPKDIQGLRLGPALWKLLHSESPEEIKTLNELGFSAESIVEGWDLFYDALTLFKNEFGHARVPANFVVPNRPPWPKLLWDLKLGTKVASLRTTGRYVRDHQERLKDLELLGFEWAPRELRRNDNIWGDEAFSRLVTALLIYRDVLPDREIAENFTVPRTSSWPVSLHDLPLGAMVRVARDTRESLTSHTLNTHGDAKLNFDILYSGLLNFQRIYNSCKVPLHFVVPNNTEWASELRGFPLGEVINSVSKDPSILIPRQKQFLAALGVQVSSSIQIQKKEERLRPFDQTHQFDIPDNCEVKARALNTLMRDRMRSHDSRVRRTAIMEGSISAEDYSNVLSQKLTEEELIRSRKLGYRLLEFGRFDWNDVARSLEAYSQQFGNVDVPQHFCVSPQLIKRGFPADCVGLFLGDAVKAIRSGDVDAMEDHDRLSQLKSFGFVWGDPNKYLRFRFFPMWLGLKHYFYVFNNVVVPFDFIVPNSVEWPVWMTDMPLGKWVIDAKRQHLLLAAEYPARKEALDAFGFDWSVSPEISDLIYFTHEV